ncbi:MAG TPA: LamG-like jellyroll fold domain-containing protein [Verrucomicrobiae bacterium]|jgi:hypothetical protein
MKTTVTLLAAVMMTAFSCFVGHAQIIYSNNFSLGAAVNISNTPPTLASSFAGGTNTAKWTDVLGINNPGALLANGSEAATTTFGDSFLLPFVPQAGHVYLLEASVTFTGNPGNWVGFGFAQNDTNNVANGFARFSDNQAGGITSPRGSDWMILTESSGNVQYFAGPGGAPVIFNANGAFTPGPGTHIGQVILNTMVSPWAIAGYVDGVPLGTNFTYASNPSIKGVGLTQNALTAPAAVQWNYLTVSASQQPFVTQQPKSQSVSAGAAYTNSVTVTVATNSGTLFYQWYANGIPLTNSAIISGANTNVLVINPVSINDGSTNYYVIITNAYGAATSAASTLTIYTNPIITGQFPVAYTNPFTLFGGANIGGTNYIGATPTFSISLLGAQPMGFQWLTNGVVVDGATNASFTFENCQLNGPTNFTCVAANSFGSASNTWLATYLPTPQAAYPQAVLSDQPIAFWRLGELDNGSGNQGVICGDYQGANNGIYTNVTLSQSGYDPSEPAETSAAFGLGGITNSHVAQIQGVDFAAANGASAEFTVEAWANCFSGGSGGGAPIITKGTYQVNDAFALGVDTNSTSQHYQFYVRGANGTIYKADSSIPATDLTWHHLVGVCDEANGKVLLYVDGILAATTAIPINAGAYEVAAPVSIGAGIKSGATGYGVQFAGYIGDVAAYNYALSAGQVIEHYASFGNQVPLAFVPPLPLANTVYQANQTLTIPVTVSGTGPFGYYWTNLTTGGVLGSGVMSASGSLDATLTIPNASASLSGDQLELVATNATGPINLFVNLFSPAPPVTLSYTDPILYSNNFNGGTWSIAGMPMTAANSLVGGTNTTWVDALGTNDSGRMQASGVSATSAQDSWVVPFTPHAGYVYTVTASLTFSGDPGSWVGLGFAQNAPINAATGYGRFSDSGTTPPQQGPNGYDWLILTEANGNVQYFAGPNSGVGITNKTSFFAAGVGTHTVQIVLDTTSTQWKAYAYVDGVSAGTNNYSSNPLIGAVGLTQNTLTAPGNIQWNSFALSQVAPGGVPPYLLNPLPPTNSIVLTNGTVAISATAFGSAPLGFYWSNNSTVVATGSTGTLAPLPADLNISSSSLSAGQLQLVATNAYGTNITLITLISPINQNPGPVQYSVAGNVLTLSWPTNLGWTLQAQTNSLSVGLSTNWVNVANSSATNQMVIPMNPTNGSVFYRLTLP